jgi:hypothetical protein
MHLLLKWRMALALVAAFVPLTPAAATLLEVEGSGAVPGFHSSEQLRGYLTLQLAETQPVNWRFEPAATGDASAPDRVKWRFKLGPYAGGEVRSFVPRSRRQSVTIVRSRSRRGSIGDVPADVENVR